MIRRIGHSHTWSLGEISDLLGGTLLNGAQPEMPILAVVSSGDHQRPSSLFVAYRGARVDGHDYIGQAFENGSVAAVVTSEEKLEGRPGILVEDSQRALSRLGAAFAGDPSKNMLTIGITGTNGKTTVHWLLYHALERLGLPGIRLGSLGISAHGLVEKSGKVVVRGSGDLVLTTPAAQVIHDSLRQALDSGLKSCVLETSSHALVQHRVSDVWYDAAIFTNLSPDHLNYHNDMESYFEAKVGLFRQLAEMRAADSQGKAVVNIDCPWGRRMAIVAGELDLELMTFGTASEAMVRIVDFKQQIPESRLILEYQGCRSTVVTSLIGDYNASNVAAAFAALVAVALDPLEVAGALSGVAGVPGRLESLGSEDVTVLVDYAHTGEGLRKTLGAVRSFAKKDLWVVFGCGGGKDPGKRGGMGKAAAEFADRIVLTSDNPRNEDPAGIIEDILSSGCRAEFVELDRGKAIERTLKAAKKGDVVVLAGKGHEDYEVVGTETRYFSDRDQAIKWREVGALDRGPGPIDLGCSNQNRQVRLRYRSGEGEPR
ncbi:MAG: UDP-N-acetylmuramoyl-L-alanyl-D-glutamate--2,6-diaminopimelate ligase [Acidobacteriota bacterium]